MKKNTKKFGILETIELISIFIYIVAGMTLTTFMGVGIAGITLFLLMLAFTVLLIVFRKRHVYAQEKPLMMAFSIYYKSLTYVVIMFNFCDFSGQNILTAVGLGAMIIYMVLSYIFGKKYYQMLNAYLYLSILGFGQGFLA